jgi:hypothetical protein
VPQAPQDAGELSALSQPLPGSPSQSARPPAQGGAEVAGLGRTMGVAVGGAAGEQAAAMVTAATSHEEAGSLGGTLSFRNFMR